MGELVTVTNAVDLEDGGLAAAFEVKSDRIALANAAGTFYAFDDTCTHRGCSLAEGELEGTIVTCPCHGGQFDVTTGVVVAGPPYDKVLIATGGRNRRLPIPGRDLEGVYDLRTVADADRIRGEIAPGRKAVVVGMGFIGSEVAASLRQVGVEVVVVEELKLPLYRVLGEEVGRVLEGIHRDHGVEMRFEDAVDAFEGSARVERVTTRGGGRIECDLVVIGVGIVVDEYCRTNGRTSTTSTSWERPPAIAVADQSAGSRRGGQAPRPRRRPPHAGRRERRSR